MKVNIKFSLMDFLIAGIWGIIGGITLVIILFVLDIIFLEYASIDFNLLLLYFNLLLSFNLIIIVFSVGFSAGIAIYMKNMLQLHKVHLHWSDQERAKNIFVFTCLISTAISGVIIYLSILLLYGEVFNLIGSIMIGLIVYPVFTFLMYNVISQEK